MSVSVAALALRIWWPVVIVLAILGALGAFVAGRDAPYVAVTTLRVDTAGFGENAQESIVDTSRLLVDSNRTYRKVVGDAPGAIDEIRSRTAVDAIGTSSVLELAVSAQTAEQAEREVDALAEASITSIRELADEQFTGTVRSGRDSLAQGVLDDPAAEQARRDAIGVAIAEQQDNALRLSASLSRIGEVPPATRVGLGVRLAMVIGALVGAIVGIAIALFLGVGRRRTRSLSDVRIVSRGLVDCEPLAKAEGISRVAAECSRLTYPLVVVLALPGAEADVQEVSTELRSELHRDGNRTFRLDYRELRHASGDEPQPALVGVGNGAAPGNGRPHHRNALPHAEYNGSAGSAALPALGMPNRAIGLAEAGADLLLITADADERTLQQVAGRADVVLLVGRRRRTRLGELAKVVDLLRPAHPPVLVLADGRIEPSIGSSVGNDQPQPPVFDPSTSSPVEGPEARPSPTPRPRPESSSAAAAPRNDG